MIIVDPILTGVTPMSKKQEIEEKLKTITDTWKTFGDVNRSLAEHAQLLVQGKGDHELTKAVVKEANRRGKIMAAKLKEMKKRKKS